MRTDSVANVIENMYELCPNCACCAYVRAAIREAQRDMYEACMRAGHSGDYAELGVMLNALRETAVEDALIMDVTKTRRARTQDTPE